jgi:hypothetical protein
MVLNEIPCVFMGWKQNLLPVETNFQNLLPVETFRKKDREFPSANIFFEKNKSLQKCFGF